MLRLANRNKSNKKTAEEEKQEEILELKKKIAETKARLKKQKVDNKEEVKEEEEEVAEIKEEEESEETDLDELPDIEPKKKEEQKYVQIPVFLTQAELNRMIYENNLLLKKIWESMNK